MRKTFEEMIEENNKKELKEIKRYLWDAKRASSLISPMIESQLGLEEGSAIEVADFLSYRLKFTKMKVIEYTKEAMYGHIFHFSDSINGKENLHSTMLSENVDYFTALLIQYTQTDHTKRSNYSLEIKYPTRPSPSRIMFSKMTEDGKHLTYSERN